MKKAVNILFLVGAIVSLVTVFVLTITGIFLFSISSNTALIRRLIEEGVITTSYQGSESEVIQMVQTTLRIAAVFVIIYSLFAVVCAILAFRARSNPNKLNCILNIVFGGLGGITVIIVASILGLVALNNENSQ